MAGYGSQGDDVLALQQRMAAAGFDPGPLDGIWGDRTQAAYAAFSGAGGGAAAAPQPSASEFANWANQRRQLADTYGISNANTAFQRGNLQADQSVNAERMVYTQGKQRESLPNSYIRRGLFGSGLQTQGQQNLATQQGWESFDAAKGYQRSLGQLDLQDWAANKQYTSGTAGVDSVEAARRADLASQIRGLF